jgi:hypothetical protein
MPAMTPSSNFLAWLRQGARAAFLRAPRWAGLHATPGVLLALLTAMLLLEVVAHRLYLLEDEARFYWPALLAGWFPTVATLLACWWVAPRAGAAPRAAQAPSASALFVMSVAQSLVVAALAALLLLPLLRAGWLTPQLWGGWAWWLGYVGPLGWALAAAALLLWRSGHGPRALRGVAALAVASALGLASWSEPLRLWYAEEGNDAQAEALRFALTPALLEAQALTLPQRSAALAPQRPGVIDVYALSYAPYADEDVFLRESKMVVQVMEQRFGATERSLMLVNHRSTAADWPWATPANLQRAIAAAAARMDTDEDVLFIHLTSHGARSGELATAFWPLRIEALTPAALKTALDAAGVKHRVISVSACYSGSWIAPLADENTLVMTAADADSTSFGCGRGSELTYYGRAVFDEALRRDTLSFEAALAQAREVIRLREVEAGKDDGYSNPQIQAGAAIRERLRRLALQRAAP